MHVLFLHRQFPAQFGQVARHLVQQRGYQCTFVSERPTTNRGTQAGQIRFVPDFAAGNQFGMIPVRPPSQQQMFEFSAAFSPPQVEEAPDDEMIEGIRRLQYSFNDTLVGFESLIAHMTAFYETLKAHPEVKPDLVVGPCIYASSCYLPSLYDCPVLNYFDYYYRDEDSYVNFRHEFPPSNFQTIRSRAHNSFVDQDLEACAAGYTPTQWQHSLLPRKYQSKVSVVFDGIDANYWRRRPVERRIGDGPLIPAETRIVTYVARGLESLRGFDIFMKVAKRICEVRSNVGFIVVGSEDYYHGGDLGHIQEPSFLQHVLRQDYYDLSRFIFAGRIPSWMLANVLSFSDLHIYLSAPFVLSWSLFDAMAAGCTILASNTTPVREVLQHEQNSLLADFFDVDELTRLALQVLDEPQRFQPLGQAAAQTIEEKYSLERVVPQMVDLFERVARS